jgi:paraquat-inducible protein B
MSDPAPDPSSRTTWLVWLVPLVALAASGWLLHRQYRDRGPVITIDFANGAGLQAGKTPLLYKGVTIGLVEEVALKPGLDGVRVRLALDQSAAPLAVEGSEFWLVHPEIGFSGVRGLDTLLSGTRLHVRPGQGAPVTRFSARLRPPPDEDQTPGRTFVLRSDLLGSLHAGTGVYYREVKVGVIEQHRLAPDATHVLIEIKVFAPYDRLVQPDTRFWNSGGITMKLGLTGAQMHSNSLESLVAGGVSFATPDHVSAAAVQPAAEGTVFDLHPEGDKAWLKWRPAVDLGSVTP